MRLLAVLFFFLASAAAAAAPAAAQEAAADTAAVLEGVAAELAAEGREELADQLRDVILRRWPDSPAAERIRALRVAGPPRLDRGGRVELLVWSTLYGLWLGVAVPAALGADGPEPYGVGLLVGGPAGFLLSRAYTRERAVGEGDARAITFGGLWGTWQGYGWREVLDLGEETRQECFTHEPRPGEPVRECYTYEESSHEANFATMIAGGLAGIVAGAVLAERREIPHATAALVNFGALWGTWYGFGIAELLDIGENESDRLRGGEVITGEADDDALLAWTLVGGNVGLASMALLAPRWDMSLGRARLISIAGVAGLLGGAGLDLLIQPDDGDVALFIPLLTSAAGLAIGAASTRDYDARPEATSPGGGALLEIERGRLALDLPLPSPTLLRGRRADGRMRTEPALGFTLLRASF